MARFLRQESSFRPRAAGLRKPVGFAQSRNRNRFQNVRGGWIDNRELAEMSAPPAEDGPSQRVVAASPTRGPGRVGAE
jgi:hypothetical protein